MSPLRLEAAYERVPAPAGTGSRDAVRWGVRASFSRDQATQGPEPAALEADVADEQRRRARPARLGPARGPREIPADTGRGSSWLAYTRAGAPIPLDLMVTAGGRSGALLDVRA
jgi:hypothetical protein